MSLIEKRLALADLDRQLQLYELMADLSRQLDGPLRAMSEYIEACDSLAGSEPTNAWSSVLGKWTKRLVSGIDRAQGVTTELQSEFARYPSENVEPLEIDLCLAEVIEMLSMEVPDVTLQMNSLKSVANVLVRPRQTEYLLFQLLRHSCDLTGSGGIVTIGLDAVEGNLRITISIRVDDYDAWLQPIQTLDRQKLHLAACRRILANHETTIRGQRGETSTLRFSLPLCSSGSEK